MRYRMKLYDDTGNALFEAKEETPDKIIKRMKKMIDEKGLR